MKRVYIKSLYNSAKTSNVPLLFDSTLSSKIPVYKDESGNNVDADFITYYVQNHALFDRYIKYMHGSKIYRYDEEEFQTALPAFKDHIEALLFANIDEFAGMFAKETINHKFILGNKIFKTDTLGEETGRKTFGQDSTTYNYGQDKTDYDYAAKHSEAKSPQKTTTSHSYNRSYELENLEEVSKTEATSNLFVDELDENARKDSITKAARIDSTVKAQKIDSFQNDQTINTYETIDNSRYYENMNNIPEFEDCIKRIINKLIIETGASYEY